MRASSVIFARKRLSRILVLASSLFLVVTATASAQAATGPAADGSSSPTVTHKTVTAPGFVAGTAVRELQLGTMPATSASPAVSPPTSCNVGPVNVTVTSYYTNNLLTGTSSVWSDVVSCLGTGSETMEDYLKVSS